MTIPATEAQRAEDDGYIQSAIDKVFMQPVQTVEMLQDSFTTQPSYEPSYTDVKEENTKEILADKTIKSSSIDSLNIEKRTITDGIEEVCLEGSTIVNSALLSGERTEIPFAKVDNFVDEDEDVYIPKFNFPSGHSEQKFVNKTDSSYDSKNFDINLQIGNDNIEKFIFESRSMEHYKVQVLNTIKKEDPLPGESDFSTQQRNSSTSIVPNKRILNFSHNKERIGKESIEVKDCINPNETYENKITEFQLDENYDYDNVSFVPKFSAEILNLLKKR